MVTSFDTSESGRSTDSYSTCMDDSLDDAQARKAALEFLCRINADCKEVERFLTRCPEALLFGLEDEGYLEEILIKQMDKCTCYTQSCNENRRRLIRLLRRGFEFYGGATLGRLDDEFVRSVEREDWEAYSPQLRDLQRGFRILKQQDIEAENQIIDAIGEANDLRYQLEVASKQYCIVRSPLFKLTCWKVRPNDYEERASLEAQLGAATLRLLSVEKDYRLLQLEQRAAKRLQHALFKTIFNGCQRHVCDASRVET
jgi:hypothetical protein